MTSVTIPDALTFIIPLVITMLSHYLRDAKLSATINGLIALASIVVIAVACVWLSGSWTGNPQALVSLVLVYVGYLARNDFQAIMAWLFATDSPVAPAQAQHGAIVAPSGTFSYPTAAPATTKYTTAPLLGGTTRTATVQRPDDRSGI